MFASALLAAVLLQAPVMPPPQRSAQTATADSPSAEGLGSALHDLPHAFVRLVELPNLLILTASGAGAAGVHRGDIDMTDDAAASAAVDRATEGGAIVGSGYVQAGAALGTLLIGRLDHRPGIAALGADLVEAQVVSGIMTEGLKYSVNRTRPNGGRYSFPSGHSSASFATAAVLERHFGWKIGLPAYAMGTYVAASRLHDRKHFASDVIFGAGIGLVSGRVARAHGRRSRVSASVVPLDRGIALAGAIACPW